MTRNADKQPERDGKGPCGLPLAGLILLAAGIALAIIGFLAGGAQSVLQKAIRICLECVGIG